jgi:hypothetical protein
MASSNATTPTAYLAKLPPDRRAAIAAVRDAINAKLPKGFEETMQYGMISWIVPPSRLEKTYNGQPLALASLGSQKNYMALYLMTVYGDQKLAAWFRAAFAKAGKKLDMGKACVRFKTIDALPLDVIGETISKVSVETYVGIYEASRSLTKASRSTKSTGRSRARAKSGSPSSRSRRTSGTARR